MVYQQIKEHHTIKISDGDQYYGHVARLKHKKIIVTSLERQKKTVTEKKLCNQQIICTFLI
jgi:hypothetical protein